MTRAKIEPEDGQKLSLSKRGNQSEQLALADDFEELKKSGLNLRPLLGIVQRNIFLIAGLTTVVAAANLCLSLASPRSYEGNFGLLVEPLTSEARRSDPSALARTGGDSSAAEGVDYASLLEILRSTGLLTEIVKQIQTRYPDVSYELLSQSLIVERVGTNLSDSTKVIRVVYSGEDPEQVKFILKEVANGYLNYSLRYRQTYISGGIKFVDDQIPGLEQQVNKLEKDLQSILQRYNLSDPASEGEALANQFREIAAQKLETQRQLNQQKALYTSLQKQLSLAPNQALAASVLSEEPRYQELLTQLKKIETQIAIESARFRESPSIQKLREQQKNLSLLLNQESQRILGQNISSIPGQALNFQNSTRLDLIKQLADTANQVQVLEVRNQEIARTESTSRRQVKQFPEIINEYNAKQRQLEIATKTLTQLLGQRETLRLEAAQKATPWHFVSEPRIEQDAAGNAIPSSRGTSKKILLGAIAGCVLGLGAAVIKERYRDVFYTTDDIQDAIKVPVLGIIPFNRNAKRSISSTISKTVEGINTSLFSETFNSLYANISFLDSDSPVRSLVVSPAAPEDGKTTIAVHLAEAAAATGKRVLLVDTNFRLPEVHERLGLSNQQGLSNLLSLNLNPKNFIQRASLEDNLFVLPSGQILPDSTSLLASPQMQDLMRQFREVFDLVIYDAPHLLGLADASFLAAHTDGILMVVNVCKSRRSVVMQVLSELNTLKLPVLGIVANQSEESKDSSADHQNQYQKLKQLALPTFIRNQKLLK